MAVIYYPKSSFMYRKDTISASYETLVLAVNPDTILYFDTGSSLNALSASEIPITSSWAVSSSWAPPVASVSASYALSASYTEIALSASYAPGSPSVSASYALSASYSANSSGAGGGTDILMVQVFS